MPKGRRRIPGEENHNLYLDEARQKYTARIFDDSRNTVVEVTLEAKNLTQARRERNRLLKRVGAGKAGRLRRRPFSRYLYEVLQIMQFGKAKKTFVDFETICRLYLLPYFGETDVDAIGPRWELYKAHQKGLAPDRKLRHDRKHLIRILRYAHNVEPLRRGVPDLPLDLGDRHSREGYVYSPEEVLRLFDAASPKWRAILTLAVVEGMRIGEILRLKVADIDFDAVLVRLNPRGVKTREPRTVAISPDTGRVLGDLIAKQKSEWVFPAKDNPKRPGLNYGRSWQRLKARAKVRAGTFHDLRHTSTTWALRLGAPGAILQKNRGMSSQVMERVYTHAQQSVNREAGEQIRRVLKAGTWENLGKQTEGLEANNGKQKGNGGS